MNIKQTLEEKMKLVQSEKSVLDEEIKTMEEDFANVKLNPYGITSIDFSKRQEKASDSLKMEGVIMGLQLAIETCESFSSGTPE
jgi:hypothetical protein